VRWDNLRIEGEDRETSHLPGFLDPATVRRFDAPEAMGIRFHEVEARSAINEVPKKSRMPFRWTINPYRGCTHACVWCFARPSHTYLDFNAREDFEREIVVKVNAPELVRKELARPSWRGDHVALGTNTDPYQWVEGRYELMRGIWEALRDYANPCSVLTKSPLLLRDLDLMKEIRERADFSAALSIPTIEEKAWRATEPHTPHPRKRIEAVAKLNAAGIPTGVLIAPLQPGINDSPQQVAEIVRLCSEAGATHIGGIGLHLRGEVKEIWFDWLRENRPDLLPRYEELYARGAYLPSAESKRLTALIGSPQAGDRPRRRWRGRRDTKVSTEPRDRPDEGTERGRGTQPKLF
jgi:DNA repair photolyase